MAAFKFEAISGTGKTTHGVVDADSLRLARTRLRDMGLTPIKVEAVDDQFKKSSSKGLGLKRSPLSGYDLALLTRQISTLISAGLNIEQALMATADQLEKPIMKELVLGMRASVISGTSLSAAMSKYLDIFPEVYCAIVGAGEQSGEMAEVLDRLAIYTESREALKQKVITAFIYPALITLTAILIVGALLIYVVPQVVGVFEQSKQSLPFLTVALIFISDLLRATWLYLLSLSILGGYLFKRSIKNESFKRSVQLKLLKLPIFGKLILSINTARFARTLAILSGSGVPILTSLNAAYRSTSLIPMREAIQGAIEIVRDGGALSRALKESKLFPPILVHLIANAEQTGNLAKMLESASTQQENEVNNKITMLTSLLEPVLIITMGAIVLTIVLAVMLPIIQINQLVH
jgi:general secretion pathway protein F